VSENCTLPQLLARIFHTIKPCHAGLDIIVIFVLYSKSNNVIEIVFDVFLFGAPVTGDPGRWSLIRKVVSGRLVNGYSSSDWMLKFLYRTSQASMQVAGMQPIAHPLIENIDLKTIINGHNDYRSKIGEILSFVNFEP